MASPLLGPIAAKIGAAFASTFYPATLSRSAREAALGAPSWDVTEETVTDYTCLAIVDTYTNYQKVNGIVSAEDRKVLVLATSLAVRPLPLDRVTINGSVYTVHEVSTDPATAVWELRSRL